MLEELAREIKERARELGFDLCGIAPAQPSAFKAEYRAWLENGFHGEMAYMARDPERRLDPSRVLPDVRSIVVVAMNYCPGSQPGGGNPDCAVFARYARNEDYHDVLAPRLRELLRWIQERRPFVVGHEDDSSDGLRQTSRAPVRHPTSPTPTRGRVYVDTGPILEREVAQRAGLGWFGKNTMLINTRRGSYFLLGEILLNLPLPPDAPVEGGCGTCRACIDACPTGAIVRPYEVDARRCISYLTIELKGPIPSEFQEKIGSRVFGCDICQEVCPFNARRAAPTCEPAFQPREATTGRRLTDLLRMTREDFQAEFRRSPVKRAKWRGLLRNAAAALSSSDDPDAEAALVQALSHEEPLVREQAQRSLARVAARREERSG